MKINYCSIAGDGIGVEVIQSATNVLMAIASKYGHTLDIKNAWAGGDAYDRFGQHLPQQTIDIAKSCKAILFGSVGGPISDQMNPKWKGCEANSILALRKAFSFYANERPVILFDSLKHLSPVKTYGNVDFVIIRELLGDVYFGDHTIIGEGTNRIASDVGTYTVKQIEQIARHAFKLAQMRRKKVSSVDKANVLAMSKLWREVVDKIASDYPDVNYEHVLVDSCAMHLVSKPESFDVILAPNLFGDILSDLGASLAGSLGLLPSASFNANGFALYEPSGGSAPDIAGQGIANPTGQILSAALMLRHSFGLVKEADAILNAVKSVYAKQIITKDLALPGTSFKVVGTSDFTNQIISFINN